MSAKIEIEAECAVHGGRGSLEVEDDVDASTFRRSVTLTIKVKPCDKCLEAAKKEGHEEGREEGREQGRAEGAQAEG